MALQESTFTSNGTYPLGTITTGHGSVMVYLDGSMDAGSVTYGYFVQDSPSAAERFVPLASPAPTAFGSIPTSFEWVVGGNMRFGIAIAGASTVDLQVLVSGSY